MTTTNNTYQNLSEPFPQEMERTLNKGGASLTYIPVSEVINRMNKVIGVEEWSFSIKKWEQLGTSIVAHVVVNANINGTMVSRDGVGGQKIKMNKQGEPVDIGDEVKGAVSDALKKAVQTLGVGLYLARSEEAMEIEQVMDAPAPSSSEVENFSKLVGITKTFSDDQKQALNQRWVSIAGDTPKPRKAGDVSSDLLEKLLTEAVSVSFNATAV
jgi:recombination DNA repair RAD52 pathway protein